MGVSVDLGPVKNFSLRDTSRVRLVILVAIVMPYSLAWSSEQNLRERFLTEAPKVWQEYLDRAAHSSGVLHMTDIDHAKRELTKKFKMEFVVDAPEAQLIETPLDSDNREISIQVMNREYQFQVKKQSDGTSLLNKITWDPMHEIFPPTDSDRAEMGNNTMLTRALKYPCRGFIVFNTWIPFAAASTGFSVVSIEEVPGNAGLVEIEFSLAPKKSSVPFQKGKMVLDTNRYWLPISVSARGKQPGTGAPGTGYTVSIKVKNEYSEYSAQGDPFPTSIHQETHFKTVPENKKLEGQDFTRIWDVSFTEGPSTDRSIFYLSAYGLPEPVRLTEGRSNWLLHLNVIILLFLLVLCILRWWPHLRERCNR